VWICKAANALQQSGGILTWNHEVQISPTEPAMDTGGVVEELLQDLTILPVFTFVSREDECSASLISIDELEGDDVGPNFVATFEDPPDIPLSIAFRRTSASTRQPVSPLQLSCWKRQLVGLYVLYGEGLLTTTVSIADVSDGTTLELCIDSVCLRPSSSGLSSAADILLITPSTRITILEAEIEPPSLITEETTKISDVTDLLLGTIRTMANKTNNYNIPRIFLLSGPPGAGKTYAVKMALQLAQPTRVYTKFLQGSDIMASSSTESVTPGAVMERHFAQLKQQTLEDSTVCLVFLDECDSLMASPTAVAMLGLQLDELASADCYTRIIVVAATNNIEAVPQHLKRPGRFEQLLILAPPSLAQRLEILQKLVGESTPGLEEIAETTIGFVPVDLQALVRRARLLGLSNSRHSLDVNLRKAMVHVGASVRQWWYLLSLACLFIFNELLFLHLFYQALRDSALTAPPKATWDSIAGDAGGAKVSASVDVSFRKLDRLLILFSF
jgi:AAA+ superfamily predicted ATPase